MLLLAISILVKLREFLEGFSLFIGVGDMIKGKRSVCKYNGDKKLAMMRSFFFWREEDGRK